MSQLTIHLDAATAEKIARAAEHAGMSQSGWVVTLIEARLASAWSEEVRQLAGAWADFPEAEALREQADDLPRDPL